MSIESNKQKVREWFVAVNAAEEEKIFNMLTPDFAFLGMGRTPEWLKYRWGREDFAAAPRSMSAIMASPIQLEIVGLTAEDDKVAVEAKTDSRLKNGKVYDNAYHLVFEFRDGLIKEVREYCCTSLVNDCLNEFIHKTAADREAAVA